MVDIPIEGITKLLRLASLGKLIEGLIHNINGPMQNLGLDIEMTQYQLSGNIKNNNDLIDNMQSRIKRIEQEFNRLELMIKTTSIRSEFNMEDYNRMDINDFIEQELKFLEANLYFKHNVQTELILQKDPPLLGNLPNNFPLALGWLLQAVIEEIENQEIKILYLKTDIKDSQLNLTINTEEGNLSEGFTQILNHDFAIGILEDNNQDMGTIAALMMFKSEGISLNSLTDTTGSAIQFTVPIPA